MKEREKVAAVVDTILLKENKKREEKKNDPILFYQSQESLQRKARGEWRRDVKKNPPKKEIRPRMPDAP